jgi:hypothetical protein
VRTIDLSVEKVCYLIGRIVYHMPRKGFFVTRSLSSTPSSGFTKGSQKYLFESKGFSQWPQKLKEHD